MANPVIPYVYQRSARLNLDPRAVLAVARAESGLDPLAVGDQGTSYGLFQLHRGGALPSTVSDPRQWAASPAGIDYALKQIAGVAKGLRGEEAVNAIVRRFERPADPASEVVRALNYYSDGGGAAPAGGTVPVTGAAGVPSVTPGGAPLSKAMLRRINDQLDARFPLGEPRPLKNSVLRKINRRLDSEFPLEPPPSPPSAPSPPSQSSGVPSAAGVSYTPMSGGALAEAFYDPVGQWDNGRFSTHGIGGHSDHVHLSVTDPQAMLTAIYTARRMGLAARENPYTDRVDPVHVPGSFHYRVFPGTYNGRKLGMGLDVSGPAAKMAAYFKWALANLRGR